MKSQKILKIAFTLLITMFAYAANAQDWYVCYDQGSSNFKVDVDAPNGAGPDGTPGSWYAWTIDAGGTITAGDDPDGAGANDSNASTVTWNGTPGLYNITSTEFNSCDETTGDQTTFAIQVLKPDVINAELPTGCASGDLIITIYGNSTDIVDYNYTDGTTPTNGQVTLNDNGDGTFSADITIPAGTYPAGTNVTFNVTNVTSSITAQPDGLTAFSCSNSANLTFTSGTFLIDAGPSITPIIVN